LLSFLPAVSFARPSTASSSNLGTANDYNVFVFESATLETGGSTIEGRLAVGGLVKTRNYSIAQSVPSSDAQVPYNIVFGGAGNTTATTFSGTFYGSLVSNATITTISVPDVRGGSGISGSGNIHALKSLDLGGNNGWGGTVQGKRALRHDVPQRF
jgi:choice-of-anchor A domain-containing protein